MYRIAVAFLAVALLAQETQPVLRVTTRLVQVSVVVHDKSGRPVAGLTKDDFTLYEKGKPRKIAFFSVVEGNTFLKVAAGAQQPPNLFPNRVKGAETATSATVTLSTRDSRIRYTPKQSSSSSSRRCALRTARPSIC